MSLHSGVGKNSLLLAALLAGCLLLSPTGLLAQAEPDNLPEDSPGSEESYPVMPFLPRLMGTPSHGPWGWSENPARRLTFEQDNIRNAIWIQLPDGDFRSSRNRDSNQAGVYPRPGLFYARRLDSIDSPTPWTISVGVIPRAVWRSKFELHTSLYQPDPSAIQPPAGTRQILPAPEGADHELRWMAYGFTVGLAHRFSEQFDFGLSLDGLFANVSGQGLISQDARFFRGRVFMPVYSPTYGAHLYSCGRTRVNGLMHWDSLWSFGFQARIGAVWRPGPRLEIGLSYAAPAIMTPYRGQGELSFRNELAFDNRNELFVPALGPAGDWARLLMWANQGVPDSHAFGDMTGKYDVALRGLRLPQQVDLELQYSPSDCLTLRATAGWADTSWAFDEIEVDYGDGSQLGLNALIGGDSADQEIPLNWRDRWRGGVGADWKPWEGWGVYLDWSYESQMARADTLWPLLPSTGGHRVRFGLEFELEERVRFDVGFGWGFPEQLRAGRHRWAADYDFSRLESTQHAARIAGAFKF